MIFLLCVVLVLAQEDSSLGKSCPAEFTLQYISGGSEHLTAAARSLTAYKKQSSTINKFPWWKSGSGDATMYFYLCLEDMLWHFSPKRSVPADFESLTEIKKCKGDVSFFPGEKGKMGDDWCKKDWDTGKWHIYKKEVAMQFAFGFDVKDDGAACSGYKDCKSGVCGGGKCTCADDTATFKGMDLTGKEVQQTCSDIASLSGQAKEFACGCPGAAAVVCRKTCNSCGGPKLLDTTACAKLKGDTGGGETGSGDTGGESGSGGTGGESGSSLIYYGLAAAVVVMIMVGAGIYVKNQPNVQPPLAQTGRRNTHRRSNSGVPKPNLRRRRRR